MGIAGITGEGGPEEEEDEEEDEDEELGGSSAGEEVGSGSGRLGSGGSWGSSE